MRHNCWGCPHLKEHRTKGSKFPLFGCTAAKSRIIPQDVTTRATDRLAVFKRVPEWCPLPDTEVVKREVPAPQKTWTEVLVR